MQIVLRPIQHSSDEYAMGQCLIWPPADTDAISCTYNMTGFTPMAAVLRSLKLDKNRFLSPGIKNAHCQRDIRCISFGEPYPNIITSAKSKSWGDDSDMTAMILHTVEDSFCKSLCFTHFGFILGKFPDAAFLYSLQTLALGDTFTTLSRIVVDVDATSYGKAQSLLKQATNLDPFKSEDLDHQAMIIGNLDPQTRMGPVRYTSALQRKAESGDTDSMTALGQHYRNEVPVLSFKWLTLASNRGSQLALMMRNELAKRRPRTELLAGIQLACCWSQTRSLQT